MRPRRGSSSRAAPPFSVVTVARDESRALPGLLDSLAEFRHRGGEVVLLDTGSEDGTPELARRSGCVVAVEPRRFTRWLTERQTDRIHQAFSRGGEGPFLAPGQRIFRLGAARNHVGALARHDYQLAVDGSDRVEAMDLDGLEEEVRSSRFQVLMFETRRLRGRVWVLENRRYFHDRRAVRWAGRAHNFILPVNPGVNPNVTVLPRDQLRVTHDSEAKSRSHQLAGLALDVLRGPHPPTHELLLGQELAARGYPHSALGVLMTLDHGDVPPPVRCSALCTAAFCLAETGQDADSVFEMLLTAARRDPHRRDPLILAARCSLDAGNPQAAVSLAKAALMIPPRVGLTEAEENHHEAPHAILGPALLELGRPGEAREHLRVCLERNPLNPAYRKLARRLS